jgi:hypothetical protein
MTASACLPRMTAMKFHSGIARRMLLGTLLGLCAATALPQTPAPSLYTVEIVVFRSGSDAGALPAATAPPAVSGEDTEITLATADKLVSAATRLRGKNSGFKVLAHVAWTQATTGFDSRRGASAAQLGLPQNISGRVSLERGQYLNLRVDLTIEENGRRYRINEFHNVKANQIQYFDHPAMGVLAVFNPASAASTATPTP